MTSEDLSDETWLAQNPDLYHAVRVVQNLTPDEFMRFCRLVVEIRYSKDQLALTYVSRAFQRETGN